MSMVPCRTCSPTIQANDLLADRVSRANGGRLLRKVARMFTVYLRYKFLTCPPPRDLLLILFAISSSAFHFFERLALAFLFLSSIFACGSKRHSPHSLSRPSILLELHSFNKYSRTTSCLIVQHLQPKVCYSFIFSWQSV